MRSTYAEISLAAIRDNVAAFRDLIEPSAVCTVVKADGYGHGDVPIAIAAVEAGAAYLAVALVEEGVRLREAGVEAPVLVLSEPTPDAAPELARWELEPSVYTPTFLEALEQTAARLPVHVKVNTGMHRVGATPDRAVQLVQRIQESPNLGFESLWTHFAVADEDPEFTRRQVERFEAVAKRLDPPMVHLANTAGAVLHAEARGDMCRIGLGTYGLHPCLETRDVIDLRPAMRVVTHVTHVQRLDAGERPSYGRVRGLQQASTVVTAPIGYADGFPRLLTESGSVLIDGKRFPLAGTVTMDQIVIDVGDEDIDVGEEVVLLGRQGGEEVSADEWAGNLGTISYEVVCSIGPRVSRRYV